MFKEITYKKKFFAVVALFLLLLIGVYKKTYRNIIDINGQLKDLSSKSMLTENSVFDISNLKEEIKVLDNFIGSDNIRPEQVQQGLLTFISDQDLKIDLVDIENIHTAKDGEFNVYTNQIELQGDYKSLLTLLYELEKNFKESKIVNTSFYTLKDYRRNRKKLYLKIIFQNYEKSN